MLKWLMETLGLRKASTQTLICIRQEDTWWWPEHLGARTSGVCSKCGAAIFYEKQNQPLNPKICHVCGGGFMHID